MGFKWFTNDDGQNVLRFMLAIKLSCRTLCRKKVLLMLPVACCTHSLLYSYSTEVHGNSHVKLGRVWRRTGTGGWFVCEHSNGTFRDRLSDS